MDRIILHCDLNSFYASVELRSRPDLRNVPVAVCGDPTSRHGIILAKNEPAKKFGVQTAETIWQAKKKCPELVLLPPHHKLYRQVSKEVNAIYEQYTDLVEPFGIDESWLDVTHTLHLFGGDAKALADHLRQRMKREMGLTLSVGVTYSLGKKTGWDKSPNLEALLAMDREQISALEMSLEEQQQENMRLAALLEENGIAAYDNFQETDTLLADTLADYAIADSIRVWTAEELPPQSVFFNLGSVEIASRKELVNLKDIAEFAKAGGLRIVLTGYADTRSGSPDVNLDISRKRAETVAAELVKMGVPADRIRVVAGGGVDTLTPYSYNRRVIITFEP